MNRWYYTVDNVTDGNLSGIINRDYKSVISKDDFIVLEDEENLEKIVTASIWKMSLDEDTCGPRLIGCHVSRSARGRPFPLAGYEDGGRGAEG